MVDGISHVYSDSKRQKGARLVERIESNGYLRVAIIVGKKIRHKTIHSLVAEAVYGPRPEGYQVNHKDGNKLNNHPDNLEYVTPQQNTLHSIEMGTFVPLQKVYEGKDHGMYIDGRTDHRKTYRQQYYLRKKLKREDNA